MLISSATPWRKRRKTQPLCLADSDVDPPQWKAWNLYCEVSHGEPKAVLKLAHQLLIIIYDGLFCAPSLIC